MARRKKEKIPVQVLIGPEAGSGKDDQFEPYRKEAMGRVTRSPYFAITGFHSRFTGDFLQCRYVLTHIPSGRSVFHLKNIRQGELLAVILDRLPIAWNTVSGIKPPPDFPAIWQAWIRQVWEAAPVWGRKVKSHA